jgi:hypothetical protein
MKKKMIVYLTHRGILALMASRRHIQQTKTKKRVWVVAICQEIKENFLTMIHKGIEFVLLFDVVLVSTVEMGNLG